MQISFTKACWVWLQGGQVATVPNYMSSVFGYDYGFRGYCLLIIFAYVIAFRVMGILALRCASQHACADGVPQQVGTTCNQATVTWPPFPPALLPGTSVSSGDEVIISATFPYKVEVPQ